MSRIKKMKERDTAEDEKEEKDEEKRRIKMEDEKRIRRLGRGIIMIKKVIGEAKNLQNKNQEEEENDGKEEAQEKEKWNT